MPISPYEEDQCFLYAVYYSTEVQGITCTCSTVYISPGLCVAPARRY